MTTNWTSIESWSALNGLKAELEYEYEPADYEVGIMSDDYIINRVCVAGVDIFDVLSDDAADKLNAELREHVESEREAAREEAGERRAIDLAEWRAMDGWTGN